MASAAGLTHDCQVGINTEGVGKVLITAFARDWRTALGNLFASLKTRSPIP